MHKLYRKLTKDQRERGVIFSSTLVYEDKDDERSDVTRHEVFSHQDDVSGTIARLKDDSFFNESQYSYNVIRQ